MSAKRAPSIHPIMRKTGAWRGLRFSSQYTQPCLEDHLRHALRTLAEFYKQESTPERGAPTTREGASRHLTGAPGADVSSSPHSGCGVGRFSRGQSNPEASNFFVEN